jgi:hypothetical protein
MKKVLRQTKRKKREKKWQLSKTNVKKSIFFYEGIEAIK